MAWISLPSSSWNTHTQSYKRVTEGSRLFTAAVPDLSVTLVLHQLPHLELCEVQEEGLGEVLEGVGCSQVRDQTPLLQ